MHSRWSTPDAAAARMALISVAAWSLSGQFLWAAACTQPIADLQRLAERSKVSIESAAQQPVPARAAADCAPAAFSVRLIGPYPQVKAVWANWLARHRDWAAARATLRQVPVASGLPQPGQSVSLELTVERLHGVVGSAAPQPTAGAEQLGPEVQGFISPAQGNPFGHPQPVRPAQTAAPPPRSVATIPVQPPMPPTALPALPAATPPALEIRVMGWIVEPDGRRSLFLAERSQVLRAERGAAFASGYRIEEVAVDAVELLYAPLGYRTSIRLTLQ